MRPLAFAAPVLLIVLLAPSLAAQRNRSSDNWIEDCRRNTDRWGSQERFCEERTIGWAGRAGGALTVDAGPNGGVSVAGWDRDSVHVLVRVQAQAGSAADAEALAREVRVSRDGGRLSAEGPDSRRRRSWSVSYVVFAPKRMDLTLTTVNGPLAAEEISGTIRMDARNGPLTLTNLGGDVRAEARNGPLTIVLNGTTWTGAGLDAETANGPLTVSIPGGYNARLETGTVNGPMDVDFPVTVQGRIGFGRRQHLITTLGTGGPTIRAVTTNGPARIRRI